MAPSTPTLAVWTRHFKSALAKSNIASWQDFDLDFYTAKNPSSSQTEYVIIPKFSKNRIYVDGPKIITSTFPDYSGLERATVDSDLEIFPPKSLTYAKSDMERCLDSMIRLTKGLYEEYESTVDQLVSRYQEGLEAVIGEGKSRSSHTKATSKQKRKPKMSNRIKRHCQNLDETIEKWHDLATFLGMMRGMERELNESIERDSTESAIYNNFWNAPDPQLPDPAELACVEEGNEAKSQLLLATNIAFLLQVATHVRYAQLLHDLRDCTDIRKSFEQAGEDETTRVVRKACLDFLRGAIEIASPPVDTSGESTREEADELWAGIMANWATHTERLKKACGKDALPALDYFLENHCATFQEDAGSDISTESDRRVVFEERSALRPPISMEQAEQMYITKDGVRLIPAPARPPLKDWSALFSTRGRKSHSTRDAKLFDVEASGVNSMDDCDTADGLSSDWKTVGRKGR